MNRSLIVSSALLLAVLVCAQLGGGAQDMTKPRTAGRSSPSRRRSEQATPAASDHGRGAELAVPGHTIGEAVGRRQELQGPSVRVHPQRQCRSARGATGSQLFEFDQNLKFVKQWGPDNYAASFAHTVRVDKLRQRVDDGRRLQHGRQVQSCGHGLDGARQKARGHRFLRTLHRSAAEGRSARAGRRRRNLQSADRRDLGFPGQHLSWPMATTTHAS